MTKSMYEVRIEELAQEVWEMLDTDATYDQIENWLLSHGASAKMIRDVHDYNFRFRCGGTITVGPRKKPHGAG